MAEGSESAGQENRLIAERRRKLHELRARAIAFPNDFRRDALAAGLHASYDGCSNEALAAAGARVSVAGRIMAKRVMGKNSFVSVQDHTGQIQLFVQREALGADPYAEFKKWDLGDIVGATGTVFRTHSGELSIAVESLRLLVKSLRPLPEKWHGIADQELKFRQRYVDLIVDERSREIFRRRRDILRYIRDFLDGREFVEVETPMMQPVPGGATARPFVTYHNALDMTLYLRIAPELYLKRLVVGGFERVYEINRVFRNEGLSTRHNPEFTILELYEAYADYTDLMTLTETLLRSLCRTLLGSEQLVYQGRHYDLAEPFERVTVAQTLRQALPELTDDGIRDRATLERLCRAAEIPVAAEAGPGKLQIELFEKLVEPTLTGPVFVTQYPAEVSPLARRRDDDPFLTDRFELFVAGRELANGFSELNDPEDQAERFQAQARAKAQGDEEAMVYDHDFIRALEYGMPPTAGLGIGMDRLVMLLTDTASIREVLLFPQLRPES